MSKLKLLIIEGSIREGRKSQLVANLIQQVAKEEELFEVSYIDPAKLGLDFEKTNYPEYSEAVKKADAFVIVIPEYNHAMPGSLKFLLDTEYENYKTKPVLIAGVSSGSWGGLRAIESSCVVLRRLGMILMQNDLQFPKVGEIFDQTGKLADQKYLERISKALENLYWYSKVMKFGREENI